MTIDSELDYIVTISPSIEGSYDLEVSASNSGSLAGTIGSPTDTENITLGSQNEITALALDPQAGIYFVAEALNPGTDGQPTNLEIFREPLGSAVTSLSNPVATASFTTGSTIEANIQAIGVDAPDDTLYYTGGNKLLDASFSGANFTGTETTRTLATVPLPHETSGALAGIYAFALDQPNHAAYLAVATNTGSSTPGGAVLGGLAGNYIYKVTGLTSGATAGTISTTISVPLNDGQVTGIAVDSANEEVFFVTEPASGGTEKTSGLYRLSGTTITPIWTESTTGSVSSLPVAELVGLVIDPATGDYYATSSKGIYEGNITLATAPTLVVANTNVASRALAIDDGPSVSAVSVLAIDGSTSHTAGELYTGDTLTLAVTFSEPVIVSGAPTITLNDSGAATYSSGAGSNVLDFTYAPASGQNTATLAATGDSGTITGEDNAPLGGSITGTFTSLGVDTTPPTVTLTGTATEPLQGGAPINPITNVVIGDPAGTGLLTGALVTLVGSTSGDVFGITGALSGSTDGGTISYSETAGVLTLSGTAGLAAYEAALEAITYQDGASQATPHPARTFAVTVKEVSLTSTLATDIITIDHAPVAASGGFSAKLAAGASLSGTNLLAGDTDSDNDTLAITSISGAGGTIIAGTTLAGTYGVISITAAGTYSYTANNSAAISGAPAGSTPADDFTITISDEHGGFTTEAVVFDVARAPTIAAGGTVTAHIGYPVTLDAGATVTDPDGASISAATIAISSGFEAGDSLALTSPNGLSGSYNAATGILTLTGTAAPATYQAAIESIVFSSPSYNSADTARSVSYVVDAVDSGVTVAADAGSALVISDLPCFCTGTRLLAAHGEVAVEDVRVGDELLIVRPGGPLTRRVVWTGRRSLDISRHAEPARVRPVRIRAGAIAPGMPEVDLRVSPQHALYLDGALVEAIALVNGVSIFQEPETRFVTYHHVELDAHDIILAEGLPCETYLDTGSRHEFEGEAALALHPAFARGASGTLCAPLVQDAAALAAIRQRFAARHAVQAESGGAMSSSARFCASMPSRQAVPAAASISAAAKP
jgi:VCBS repeat-containing protein